jgi:glycosyltransferase involved in cell wall biosynthesis
MVKISILIPVYNAKDFLYDSIPCLLNQTFKDTELICVNDGSKDNSLEILNEFASKDERIKVIDKENGGCGSARNRALAEASGDYVYFFDPDDEIENNTLELAYNSAVNNDSDIVIFKANVFDKNGISNRKKFFYYNKTLDEEQFDNFSHDDVKEYVLKGGYAPWSKLYKREFLDSYDDFQFDVGMAFDDVPFHVKSLLRAKRMSFINKILYHYRVDNVNSVNSTASNGFDIFKIIDIVKGILINENCFDEFKKEFYTFSVVHILLYIISTNSSEYFEIARERFKSIDESYIKDNEYLYNRYNMVLSYDDFNEFKPNYEKYCLEYEIDKYANRISKLKSENSNLKKENKKLKKMNKQIKNSNSWKVTNLLRKIKK